MNTRSIPLIILAFAVKVSFGQISNEKERLSKLYNNGQYSEAYLAAIEVRKKEYGKTVGVDYIIAKSLCSLGKKQNAIDWYDNMLKYYKLDSKTRAALKKDQQSCRTGTHLNTTSTVRIDVLNTLASMDKPQSTTSGKSGTVSFDCTHPPQKFKIVRAIPDSEMESRLFDLNESEAAIAKFSEILGPDYHIRHSGGFIIVTKGSTNVNQQQADKVSAQLQKSLDFYVSNFSLRPPNKLITVCLLPSKSELQQTAEILHGIQIPNANWGYSNIADLTLLGWSDSERIGTLNHELFHLVIRTDIGDAPPWLDEGIASLYERSVLRGDQLQGLETNWRTKVLREAYDSPNLRSRIPTLEDFLGKNWNEFDGDAAGDICNTTINFAYGRHFIVYLQKTGKLKQVFDLMKNRTTVNTNYEISIKSSVQVVEEAMGKNITEIEADFKNWLFSAFSMSISSNSNDWGQVPIEHQAQEEMSQNSSDFANSPATNSASTFDLNQIEIHVKRDPQTTKNKQQNFTYYIKAPHDLLLQISEAYYQRDHNSFAEFRDGEYISSNLGHDNFSFSGYQYGTIKGIRVYFKLKNGTLTEVKWYELIYDN